MRLNIIIILLIILITTSCDQNTIKTISEAEMQEIEQTISSCIGWFKDKDFDLLFSVVAHDSNYISVHPTNNVVMGFDHFQENSEIFKYAGFQYVRHELKDLRINISESGTVAWWYCILDDINTWDEQPANWENTRWTGILEKRNNKWVIVQQHFSFAQE